MKRIAWVAGVLALLSLAGVGGAGWYYSGLVIDPSHGDSYPLEVVSYDGSQVTLRGGGDTDAPGTFGLTWASGNALLGDVVTRGPGTVTRKVDAVRRGTLEAGVRAYLDRWMWVTRIRGRRSACRTGRFGSRPSWGTSPRGGPKGTAGPG